MWEEFRAGPEEYGNDALVNERMVSYQIGYRGQWRQNLGVNVEGYVNQDTDMIAKQFDASTSYPEYIPGKPFWKLDVRLARRLLKDLAEIAVGVTNLTDAFHYEGGYDWTTGQYIEVPRMAYAQFFCRF